MRIIRGKLKSLRLSAPKGFDSRPTTNYSKEALFNIIDNRFNLEGMEILDLCAGTGNISLEFVSGDAGHVLAVDQNFKCVKYLQNLAVELNIEKEFTVLKSEVIKFLETTEKTFDIIFADPPYATPIHDQIADIVFERKLLNEDGILIIEHGKRTSMEKHPHFDFLRKYSSVHYSFLQ